MNKDLIRKSCEWIDKNFNATNANLPEELLNTWYIDDIAKAMSGDPDYEDKMSIFAYALLKSKIKKTGSKDVRIEEKDYSDSFPIWIFKLVTMLRDREGEVKILEPFKLFNFDKSEMKGMKIEKLSD